MQRKRMPSKPRGGKCDACGLAPPKIELASGVLADILHYHHILPVSFGGKDDRNNIALLCPTCHAIAHALFRRWVWVDGEAWAVRYVSGGNALDVITEAVQIELALTTPTKSPILNPARLHGRQEESEEASAGTPRRNSRP